jgi:hypothetical protein
VQGKPVRERLDQDMDSRMETRRRFRKPPLPAEGAGEEDILDYKREVEFSESDWDGNGIFETAEEYLPDGRIIYSWDMDGDGLREYSEMRMEND